MIFSKLDMSTNTPVPVVIDALGTMYPSRSAMYPARVGSPAIELALSEASTYYAVVISGRFRVTMLDDSSGQKPDSMEIGAGAFVSSSGKASAEVVEDGVLYVIERLGYRGTRQCGRIERNGRLSYIDGCSDSLLVYPSRMGDPCLNYLHFPKGIKQTQHLHPSIRLGIVLRGRGLAWGPGWEEPLVQGSMFMLNEQEIHSFTTPDDSMDIVAFHPDSDWGPVDANHPMLNRTYINHGK